MGQEHGRIGLVVAQGDGNWVLEQCTPCNSLYNCMCRRLECSSVREMDMVGVIATGHGFWGALGAGGKGEQQWRSAAVDGLQGWAWEIIPNRVVFTQAAEWDAEAVMDAER